MTFRDKTKERLQILSGKNLRAKQMFVVGLIILGVLTVTSAVPLPDLIDRILFPFLILSFALFGTGWNQHNKATFSLHKKLPCPSCGKNLSYLLSDKEYSKCRFWEIPKAFPEGMNDCPYCKTSFDAEIKQAEPVK